MWAYCPFFRNKEGALGIKLPLHHRKNSVFGGITVLKALSEVGEHFRLKGIIENYEPINNGNVNKTYKVSYITPRGQRKLYVFQLVNTYVFKDPDRIMKNIELVTAHLKAKCGSAPALHCYHTEDGKNFLSLGENGFWRVMNYIESVTFNETSDPRIIAGVGTAFGRFQNQLADLDGSLLYETIKDFHHTKKRIGSLFDSARKNPVCRTELVEKELDYIASVAKKASELSVRYENGEFPVRVTHNDTKSNNVLFDKATLSPIAVIDLDTVMPGMAMYDFGDGARFIASSAPEDTEDIGSVYLNTEKFSAFCRGYISEVRDRLTTAELDAMVLGAFSVTVELAARFLEDYINGDLYFKTLRPHHNLIRARCQIALAKDISEKYDGLFEIVRKYSK